MLELYAHPLSSYCWKAMIALDELGLGWTLRTLGADQPENEARFRALWPLAKMPLLVDDGRPVAETSIIIEHLDTANRLIPAERAAALRVRFLDRLFDNYMMTPMQAHVSDRIRPDGSHDPLSVDRAGALLDRSYAWLEAEIGEAWAAGAEFSLADCAAAPSLFYADKVRPLGEDHPKLSAYLARLVARPSVAKAIAGAQPYWQMFPYA